MFPVFPLVVSQYLVRVRLFHNPLSEPDVRRPRIRLPAITGHPAVPTNLTRHRNQVHDLLRIGDLVPSQVDAEERNQPIRCGPILTERMP